MATMKEVAKAAGVSIITVSRVINTPEKVKKETREKVLKYMQELDFKTNQTAKALVSNRTKVIHVYIPNGLEAANPFVMNVIAGISEELSKSYYSLFLRRDRDIPLKSDGIIAMGLNKSDDEWLANINETPIVLFGHTDLPIDWLDVDNKQGAYKMTDYIIKQGHRKIGFIGIDENKRFATDRLQGYCEALHDHEMKVENKFIRFTANEEIYGYEKTLDLLTKEDVSALFCSSDVLALGALRAARTLRRKVPEELSIAGFDGFGLDLLAYPALTTMTQPVYEAGKQLAMMILDRIENPNHAVNQKMVKTSLTIRKSVRNLKADTEE
ncbi:LacI family DNA-binding transcriptional regulator [Bacillus spongiae]|uniref:LacI family DNA-binding transcriptional regulator n=1 Tax=Bacillus spongiae TaxID=2683610 RepID=A0ABU8H8P1_9BACI